MPNGDDDFWDDYLEEERGVYRRDSKVDDAKAALKVWFDEHPQRVFYEQQLKVIFEAKPRGFFQWITAKAIDELHREGYVQTRTEKLEAESLVAKGAEGGIEGAIVRFLWSRKKRYVERDIGAVLDIVRTFSKPIFGRALGQQGEMLADNALMNAGFTKRAEKVRSWSGKSWQESGHDLDRVYERDGVCYGAEIKNTLKYIEKVELETKIRMCRYLGLRPLVIARSLPKHYVNMLQQAGGFGFIVGKQLYPFGYEDFAEEVRNLLGLPVECSRSIEAGRVKKFLDWHLAALKRSGL